MRPKTKNTIFHAQTTKNTKNKTTKKKKQTTTTQLSLLFLSHSRPLYSSHTTHHPTHNTQPHATHVQRPQPAKRSCLIKGWFYRTTTLCCPRHPTACQTTKQTKTQTHSSLLHWSPHTRNACGTCFHLQTKTLSPPDANQHPAMTKNLPLTRR